MFLSLISTKLSEFLQISTFLTRFSYLKTRLNRSTSNVRSPEVRITSDIATRELHADWLPKVGA